MSSREDPYQALRRDFEAIVSDMQKRFDETMKGIGGTKPLPGTGAKGAIQVDVRDQKDAIVLEADLPGVDAGEISIRLLGPRTLQISTEKRGEREEGKEGYYLKERSYGGMSRTVTLPEDVTDEGATANFRNGVLEVRLIKTPEERGKEIRID